MADDAILRAYGWDDRWDARFSTVDRFDREPGRIARWDRSMPLVALQEGLVHLPVRRSVGQLAVGDWVAVERGHVVTDLVERTSLLRRRDPAGGEQLLAANVDVAAVVFGADRPLKAGRLFRTRTQILDAGAEPLVILTKSDLVEAVDGADPRLAQVHELDPWLDSIAVSAATGQGLQQLRERVGGRTLVLLGESGAGKSTLVNALVGGDLAAVAAVRVQDHRGRHTTTSRELHPLPGGGVLIDTPGLREVGLWTDEAAVDAAFPEMDELAEDCRFRDCTHGDEPGCAVHAALEAGELSRQRFAAWEALRREAASAALRSDEHERRAADRRFGRLIKSYQRLRPRPSR